jgi:hypothetical protein
MPETLYFCDQENCDFQTTYSEHVNRHLWVKHNIGNGKWHNSTSIFTTKFQME